MGSCGLMGRAVVLQGEKVLQTLNMLNTTKLYTYK